MAKFTDTVAWVMEDDAILKVKDKGVVYDIDKKVIDYLASKEITLESLVNKSIEIEVNEKEGQNGLITKIILSSTKKEEPKQEEKRVEKSVESSSGLTVKELTVKGVSVAKASVTFVEEDKVWYTLDSTINAQEFKDNCTRQKIEVSIVKQEKGNDVIKGYVLKAEPKKDPIQKAEETVAKKSAYTTDVQKSIEAQASVNSANEVVSHMTDILLDPQKVLTTITKIAEHNFKLIQELKNKE